jgi:NADH-quinone oxidoreductase subunit C
LTEALKELGARLTEALKELGAYIQNALPQDVLSAEVRLGELMLRVHRNSIVKVLAFLKDDSNCQYPEREERFEVVYNLLSVTQNQRVRLKVATDEATPVPSATGVYKSAGWFERETWDLYGVFFSDHPDLRRILTDYGFQGHPMRKDFPLTGYVEVRYDEEQKRVVYEPVKLPQEFRSFDFLSPWEGTTQVLPGDEKAMEEAG